MSRLNVVRRFSRAGWVLVLGGFVAGLGWAALAPLDRGVAVSGRLVVEGQRQSLQPAAGGVVERIEVANGDRVVQGQALIVLEGSALRAQLRSLQSQYRSALATQMRLEAQDDERAAPAFSEEALAGDGVVLQGALFDSQAAARQAERKALAFAREGSRQQVLALRATLATEQQQRHRLEEQLGNLRQLAQGGLVSRHRVLEVERQHAQLVGAMADGEGRLHQAQAQVQALAQRLDQHDEQQRNDIRSQLLEVRVLRERLHSEQVAVRLQLAQRTLRAPAAGIVTGQGVFTQGAVVAAGQGLLDIIPENQPLLLEARLPVQWVEHVSSGLAVELMFSSLGQSITPRGAGEVLRVSADREVEPATGEPYYLMHIRLAQTHELALRPGMPVDAFIVTGEHSLLSYLFKPLLDRAAMAMGDA